MLPSLHQLSLRPARADEEEEEGADVTSADSELENTLLWKSLDKESIWRQLPQELFDIIKKEFQDPNDPCKDGVQRMCANHPYATHSEMRNWCQEYFKRLCFDPPVVAVPNALFPPPMPLLPFLCGPHGVYNPYNGGHQRQWRRQFAMFCNVVYGLWGTQMATRREVFEALKSLSDIMPQFPPTANLVNPNNAIQEHVFRNMPYLDIDWLPPSVLRIGTSAFEGCSGLRRLRLPQSLRTIDARAFEGCNNLVELDIPSTVSAISARAFAACIRLRRLHLPNIGNPSTFRDIQDGLCADCTQLERIDLPNSIQSIGSSAFRGCINLSAIGWSARLQRIEQGAFFLCTNLAGKVTLPAQVRHLGDEAFRYCRQMTVIDQEQERGTYVPLWFLPANAFANCNSLVKAPILRNVRTILAEAFKNCVSLVSTKQEPLPFAPILERIRTEAFAGCRSLQYVHIPDSAIEIQFSAFENCTNLAEVRLPENNRYPSGYNRIQTATFKNTGLTTIRVPSQVRFVEHDAFAGCKQLQTVSVAPHPEIRFVYHLGRDREREMDLQIGESAFLGCEKLLAFMAPKTHLVRIRTKAFEGCTSLERVAVKLCMDLDDSAFNGCTNLKTVTFYPKTGEAEDLPDLRFRIIKKACFQGCEHLTAIEIPDSVGSIRERAFFGCHRLKTVTLPIRLAEVPITCFKDCFALEEIEIPYQVRIIQGGAFDLCRSLRKVTFGRGPYHEPPRLDHIAPFAFGGCNNLEEFVLPASVTKVSNVAFPLNFVERGRVTEAARPEGSRRIYYYNSLDDDE